MELGSGASEDYLDLDRIFLLFLFSLLIRFFLHLALIFQTDFILKSGAFIVIAEETRIIRSSIIQQITRIT